MQPQARGRMASRARPHGSASRPEAGTRTCAPRNLPPAFLLPLAPLPLPLPPSGFVQSRWVWVLLFSPVWGSLYINFGLGPIISRTEDKLPIIQNTLGGRRSVVWTRHGGCAGDVCKTTDTTWC